MDFLPASGFRSLPGRRTTLGGQWRINASGADALSRQGWTAALRHEDARGVSTLDNPQQASDIVDANSTLLALRHEGAEHQMQAQMVNTQASNLSGARNGFWIDSEWDDGPRRHGVGAYRLEPDLTWANLPLANDIVGAYVRSSWRTRQWSAEGSLDWLDSISGRSSSGVFATGSARWRINRDHTLGAGTALRRFNGNAWSTYGDWRFQNGWGTSGLRVEVTGGEDQVDSRALIWDQEWMVPQGWALSTSLGTTAYSADQSLPAETTWNAAHERGGAPDQPGQPARQLQHRAQQQRTDPSQPEPGRQLAHRHALEPGGQLQPLHRPQPLQPVARPAGTAGAGRCRTATARSTRCCATSSKRGSRNVPLGGKAADGGGRIEGTVYFDANRSGTQEASETGVPNVTVFLDNRYAVRTDSQGRFEFPFVASGPRTVTVRPDTLPLPWNVVDEGQTKVDVRLRENVTLEHPGAAQRMSRIGAGPRAVSSSQTGGR